MSWLHWFDNSALVGFYALGLVAIIASLRVIVLANPVHAILSMIVTLLALAGIFFIVGAPFAGALQVIVYAGAILVLFVFVIMMLNLGIKSDERESRWLSSEVWAVPTGLTVIIALVLFTLISSGSGGVDLHGITAPQAMMGLDVVSSKEVGIVLFSHYIMLVEVAAMLLLAALVAAYHLGKRALDDENESHSSQTLETQERNLAQVQPYEYMPVDAADFRSSSHRSTNQADDYDKATAHQTLQRNAGMYATRPTIKGDSE